MLSMADHHPALNHWCLPAEQSTLLSSCLDDMINPTNWLFFSFPPSSKLSRITYLPTNLFRTPASPTSTRVLAWSNFHEAISTGTAVVAVVVASSLASARSEKRVDTKTQGAPSCLAKRASLPQHARAALTHRRTRVSSLTAEPSYTYAGPYIVAGLANLTAPEPPRPLCVASAPCRTINWTTAPNATLTTRVEGHYHFTMHALLRDVWWV